jgi:heme-degrading monooxygenase HmoA
MIVQFVKFESGLTESEVLSTAKERAAAFKKLPGLLQKYYVKLGQPNHYGGIYIWDSAESVRAFRESELAASIPVAYKVRGAPAIDIHQALFQLRD